MCCIHGGFDERVQRQQHPFLHEYHGEQKKVRLVGGFDWLECFQFALAIGSVIGTASGLQKPVPVIPKLLILKLGQKLKTD